MTPSWSIPEGWLGCACGCPTPTAHAEAHAALVEALEGENVPPADAKLAQDAGVFYVEVCWRDGWRMKSRSTPYKALAAAQLEQYSRYANLFSRQQLIAHFGWCPERGASMNITKARKPGRCAAMRCLAPAAGELPGAPWGVEDNVELCSKHYVQAQTEYAGIYAALAGGAEDPAAALVYGFAKSLAAVVAPDEEDEGSDDEEEDVPRGYIRTVSRTLPAVQPVKSPEEVLEEALLARKKDAEDVAKLARSWPMDSHEALEALAEVLTEVKGQRDSLEGEIKSATSDLAKELERRRAMYRPLKQALADAEGTIKGRFAQHRIEEEARNAALMAEAAKAYESGRVEEIDEHLSKVTNINDTKGVSTRLRWDFIIEDAAALPREFLMPNEKLIREHCNHSTDRAPTPIPGVRFVPSAVVSGKRAVP